MLVRQVVVPLLVARAPLLVTNAEDLAASHSATLLLPDGFQEGGAHAGQHILAWGAAVQGPPASAEAACQALLKLLADVVFGLDERLLKALGECLGWMDGC